MSKAKLNLLISVALLLAVGVAADESEVITDNLIVKETATVTGKLEVSRPSVVAAPPYGLVLQYSFSTDATPIADESGSGNNGTVNGATWTAEGHVGGGYDVDGVNDWISVPDAASLDPGATWTIAAWVKADVAMGWHRVVGKCAGSGNESYRFTIWDGKIGFGWNNTGGGGNWGYTASGLVTDGTWHHVVWVHAGSATADEHLYVDGVERSFSGSHPGGTARNNTGSVGIGADPRGSCFFGGSLDQVRIYNRALTVSEVKALGAEGVPTVPDPEDGTASFEGGITYTAPGGDLSMGSYTNRSE